MVYRSSGPGPRKPVTYSREAFLQARQAWIDGQFSPEWAPYQKAAAEAGFIYPPEGSRWDDPADDEPSQRAIIWQAIDERPGDTLEIVRRSRSWWDVVDRISGMRSRIRKDIDLYERDDERDRASRPSHTESTMALANILRRLEDSIGLSPGRGPSIMEGAESRDDAPASSPGLPVAPGGREAPKTVGSHDRGSATERGQG